MHYRVNLKKLCSIVLVSLGGINISHASHFYEGENLSPANFNTQRNNYTYNAGAYNYSSYNRQYNGFKEGSISQDVPFSASTQAYGKRKRSQEEPSEKNSSLCKKQRLENSLVYRPHAEALESYKEYKKKQDDQHIKLTRPSRYVEGDICARIRWVSDLGSYYGKQQIQVPSEHQKLALVGNHIKACCATIDPSKSNRNILVPFVSVLTKDMQGYHYLSHKDYLRSSNNKALVFVSGPYSYKDGEELYHEYEACVEEGLPAVQIIGGDKVSQWVQKDFTELNNEARRDGKPDAYNFHTEEWFYEVINAFPHLITEPIINKGHQGSKVCAIILDMYSWQDVCEGCQVKFKHELFHRAAINRLQENLKHAGLRLPRNGLRVIFRVLSEKDYYSDINTYELPLAEGGCDKEKGFDIKSIGSAQVTLCSRQAPTYSAIYKNIKSFYDEYGY